MIKLLRPADRLKDMGKGHGEAGKRTANLAASAPISRAVEVTDRLRELIINGTLLPGAPLREVELAEQFGVSRNTLREAFRGLGQEGVLTQIPNSGARVAIPSITSIIDVFRVRRIIEGQALLQAFPKHPAISTMRSAVEGAELARDEGDWRGVGTDNVAFHSAIIALADSARLTRIFDSLSAELRLAFGLVDDPEYLHAPFLDRNREILGLVEAGDVEAAARALDAYLMRSERLLLAAYERLA